MMYYLMFVLGSSCDVPNKVVYASMHRDRFDVILRCLHFLPNAELDKTDKYTKLHPLKIHLYKKFMPHFL